MIDIFRRLAHSRFGRPDDGNEPIRAELFSIERLEQHAASLADAQKTTRSIRNRRLLSPRLATNAEKLSAAYRVISHAASVTATLSPAAEWFLDNYHIVDEQIREVRDDLPAGYYRALPKLADGPLAGYPRVYGIAWALIAHTDSSFDVRKLTRFVQAYQRVQALTIGELWAVAITLRITLVENLTRLADGIVADLSARRQADTLFKRTKDGILEEGCPPASIQAILNEAEWSQDLAVQMSRRLRDFDPSRNAALQWMNTKLATQATSIEQVLSEDVQRQSASNVTVRNVITSMRLISTMDWPTWFESVSLVDAALRKSSNFTEMEFSSRDYYRRAIEGIAKNSTQTERSVAEAALAMAERESNARSQSGITPDRLCDPGYYLVSKGRPALEKSLNASVPLRSAIFRLSERLGIAGFALAIAALSALILLVPVVALLNTGLSLWLIAGLTALGLLPASEAAIAFLNRAISECVGASVTPGLELKAGVPEDCRTIVVMPVLLSTLDDVREHIDRLEVHHLSNPGTNLHFALLSDWTDSASKTADGDAALFDAAASGIARLNVSYGPSPSGPMFLLLHRERLWSDGEGKWIGWERKRGKLTQLNHWLLGLASPFLDVSGQPNAPPSGLRYVVTLDSDTRTPINAVKRLIGKMAHPLSQPVYDAKSGRIVSGHAIIQPRVTPALPMGRPGTLFQRVFSGPNGLDPYSFTVSDVYQDLYDEGSYVGKGIYDIAAFERAMHDKLPENTVLSHDLIEGVFSRAGLASDVEVFEEFPQRYETVASRQHRWTRGDWQLLPWLAGDGPKTPTGQTRHQVSAIGRWKIFDNLRRSLVAPTTLAGLLLAWCLPLEGAAIWTAFSLLMISFSSLVSIAAGAFPRRASVSWRNHLAGFRLDIGLDLTRAALQLVFLPHQAFLACDAIARSLYRQIVTRKKMLEWTTAAQSISDNGNSGANRLVQTAIAAVSFGTAMTVMAYIIGGSGWPISIPCALLWAASPLIAEWVSRRHEAPGSKQTSQSEAVDLRLMARLSWRYFQTFVTSAENMLPPDNFQETPKPVVAHRTSPTNIGLYLLSTVAARDFSWSGLYETVDRLEDTLATMTRMDRHRGHFFNWYDTQSLFPLAPRYVSTVDSGNLAGHLIALANSCDEMSTAPILSPLWRQSLKEVCDNIETSVHQGPGAAGQLPLHAALKSFRENLAPRSGSPTAIPSQLETLHRDAATILQSVGDDTSGGGAAWAKELLSCVATLRTDVERLAPWARVFLADPNHAEQQPRIDQMLEHGTLRDLEAAGLVSGDTRNAQSIAPSPDERLLAARVEETGLVAGTLVCRLIAIATAARKFVDEMDFGFLYDNERNLLSIGYRASDGALDANYYDLLASEARLSSFIAIAKRDVPAEHWFRMGRTMTPLPGGAALISWSGSMFEYLMPSLVMRAASGSILEQTNRLIVRRHIAYGKELGLPWGISESGYNLRDIEQTYQYSSFGVPDLGYKRDLANSRVIAPYASAMAAMVDPSAACANLHRISGLGGRGAYGWYEALDFTKERVPKGEKAAIVRSYMAHHLGMSIVAIANALHDGAMRKRFHAEPMIQSAELLLQERMPRGVALARAPIEPATHSNISAELEFAVQRRYRNPHSRIPRTQLLSNGSYSVMLTAAGSGYSQWRGLALSRWREDVTRDNWGSYIYLRDVATEAIWSAGFQPTCFEPEKYDVEFTEDHASFERNDGNIKTVMEIAVSPEDDAEVRRISMTNLGLKMCEIEVTSFSELVLAKQIEDSTHPAFSKLFVETEFVSALGALVAHRRKRSGATLDMWAAHLCVTEGETIGELQYETDRSKFVGRGRTNRAPSAVQDGWPLSNTTGAVLDAAFSLRRRVKIPPGHTVRIAFWTMAASSRDEVLSLADKHQEPAAYERATTLAWTHGQMQLQHFGVSIAEAHLFQRLANHILFSDPALRASPANIANGLSRASVLWSLGISGDLPVVLIVISSTDGLRLVRQAMKAFAYWRFKELAVDLAILNDQPTTYAHELQAEIESMLKFEAAPGGSAYSPALGQRFALRGDLISPECRNSLFASACAILHDDRGTISEQVTKARERAPVRAPAPRRIAPRVEWESPIPPPHLERFNGLGGFANQGRDYVIVLDGEAETPHPWINVISNPLFGFQASSSGSGFTWAGNSQQNKLTDWSNDPVGDRCSEAVYVRDDATGEVWTPCALPIRENTSRYVATHSQGYSSFAHSSHGVELELVQLVPIEGKAKLSRLRIVNHSARERSLSVTAYVEWTLGQSRSATSKSILTHLDPSGALFARNASSNERGAQIAFLDMCARQTSWTGDRSEFLGRNGDLSSPRCLATGAALSNNCGAAFDPCGAMQTKVLLPAAGTIDVLIFLGAGDNGDEAQELVAKCRGTDFDVALNDVRRLWDSVCNVVQIRTPDRSMDILVNRWLPYQTLSCRVWARAGFYQSGGAYGFRDQLQDTMALCLSRPDVTREHLIRAAGRQFQEGDVQHWWLPETGQGVRTRISDNRIWLAYAAAHFVSVTGDATVLDELAPFLGGPALAPGHNEAFFLPQTLERTGSVYEHCALALDSSLAVGAHGLPLMGTGDWNDGMDRVGVEGKGESVWLGWFLYATLKSFLSIAESRADQSRVDLWTKSMTDLKIALERDAWDGDWYRRAFFDDGSALGSVANAECRIDSIAQSWSVMSGAADRSRAERAMNAVDKHLIRRDERLTLLFTPPFRASSPDPGYIKGYPEGVRENGGQYTHAAVWAGIAFAMLGQGDKAHEVLSSLNPINLTSDRGGVERYRVEPYVMAADVYSVPPHTGRGGWTWYTGASGWTYRFALEWILGFRVQKDRLFIDPCIPSDWPEFEIAYRYGETTYQIAVENPLRICRGVLAVTLDGAVLASKQDGIPLVGDGKRHMVRVVMG